MTPNSCPSCGDPIQPTDRFCGQCGAFVAGMNAELTRSDADDHRVLRAFDAVWSVPPPERGAFIRERFGSDPGLAQKLERLIADGARAEAGLFAESVEESLEPVLADLEGLEALAAERAGRAREVWSNLYEDVRPLGRGGMGRTHLARERSTGRLVCIKELFSDIDRRVLEQEYRALSRLTHPNIVRLLRLEAETPWPFLTLEYVDGTDLREYMRRVASPTEAQIAGVMRPISDAIAFLHSHDIIHRDLKPENILMSNRGDHAEPILIDLGLAVVDQYDFSGQLTAAFMVMGTPLYMAPEQLSGEVLSSACDVYALGEIMFELVTDRPAWSGRRMSEVIRAKMDAKSGLKVPDSWWRRRWPVLGKLVRDCTHPRPLARPSAAALVAALDRVLHTSALASSIGTA